MIEPFDRSISVGHPAPRVFIFAKAPVLGRVKTRLAADVGEIAALAVYKRMLWRCVERLSAGPWSLTLCVTPDAAAADDAYWPEGVDRTPQGGGDLGDRMLRALSSASPASPVVVVGSDIPDLDSVHIARAFCALDHAPIVCGPSGDGGFYLIGASAPPPTDVFANVTWSSPKTLSQVIANLEPSSVVPLIDTLDDLDDMDVFERHREDPHWAALLKP
jgi:hypothetical protein